MFISHGTSGQSLPLQETVCDSHCPGAEPGVASSAVITLEPHLSTLPAPTLVGHASPMSHASAAVSSSLGYLLSGCTCSGESQLRFPTLVAVWISEHLTNGNVSVRRSAVEGSSSHSLDEQNSALGRRKGMGWRHGGAGQARKNKNVADRGCPLLISSICLLSLLISQSPSHAPSSPPWLGFLRKVCLDNQGSATHVGGVAWSRDSCRVKGNGLRRTDSPQPIPLQWANSSEPGAGTAQGAPTGHCQSWVAFWRAWTTALNAPCAVPPGQSGHCQGGGAV